MSENYKEDKVPIEENQDKEENYTPSIRTDEEITKKHDSAR